MPILNRQNSVTGIWGDEVILPQRLVYGVGPVPVWEPVPIEEHCQPFAETLVNEMVGNTGSFSVSNILGNFVVQVVTAAEAEAEAAASVDGGQVASGEVPSGS